MSVIFYQIKKIKEEKIIAFNPLLAAVAYDTVQYEAQKKENKRF